MLGGLRGGDRPADVGGMILVRSAPMSRPTAEDLAIRSLGPATRPSPLALSTIPDDDVADYVPEGAGVLVDVEVAAAGVMPSPLAFDKAGPRERIYFDPAHTTAGIVTCGGICPGINNVIRSMVLELHHKYGVARVLGFRYGYSGLDPASGLPPVQLTPADVLHIHRQGGSLLGVSRGAPTVETMVDELVRQGVQILFTIGGDGTHRGSHALATEIRRRGLEIAVVGVPKTIDNDIAYVDKTFGYETAVEVARQAVDAAHTEAISALNGIGIVKLMGRDAGFIAAAATLASRDVNFCLVPEVRFELEGPHGLLAALERRLGFRHHALVVVAEGCGASLVDANSERDASGNVRYGGAKLDVGPRLRDAITAHFVAAGVPIVVKYIDPSYMIRGCPANAHDSIFCDALARHAVHAGMAGKTDLLVGRAHGIFTHVPLALVAGARKRIDPDATTWLAVTEATGQPRLRS
jgi:6-phosphofructokinase 1